MIWLPTCVIGPTKNAIFFSVPHYQYTCGYVCPIYFHTLRSTPKLPIMSLECSSVFDIYIIEY